MDKMGKITPLLLLALLLGALAPAPTWAAGPPEPPQLSRIPGGVRVTWRGAPAALRELAAPRGQLVEIGGQRLPARLIALRIVGGAPLAPQIERLASAPWRGAVPAADQPIPQLPGGAPRPDMAERPSVALPDAPVIVLREGQLRGARVAVLALSPLFAQAGAPRALEDLAFSLPNAEPLPDDPTTLLDAPGPFAADAPPANPAAGSGWKVRVTRAGMQRLPVATLSAAGVPLANLAKLHLRFAGQEVALEQRGAGSGLELRFYAPAPGDRWNAADTYWLTAEATDGARMTGRSVAPAGGALSTYAYERGTWRDNQLYDSLLPGPDGDHWYAADLRVAPAPPGQPATAPVTLTVVITPGLMLASAPASLTVAGSSYLDAAHTLRVWMAGTPATATWGGLGDWSQTLNFPKPARGMLVTLPPTSKADAYEIDSVEWLVPVSLASVGRGAVFEGRAGDWLYRLGSPPPIATLYDVTDPRAPQLLTDVQAFGANIQFQDGPAARRYLLAGSGTLFAPSLSKSQPYDFATPARVLYVVPAGLRDALGPLLARRQAQGYAVRAIDTQAIYDRWSYGQVSPEAIRSFLRYAAGWATPPTAATLVGDGTSDPLNYTKHNNINYIPPYLANADPWMGETACESCFARLSGDDPLADELPDLALARLPARSPAELSALVAKIIAYETSKFDITWASRIAYVADNYHEANGATDDAGDFAQFAEDSIEELPRGAQVGRLYYDPWRPAPAEPWREPDPAVAHARTLDLFNAGAGLVNYIGHGSPYQWAVTDFSASPPYLLGQYDPDGMSNGARLPIVLELTCLTGAFQTPSFGGTIDERLLLAPSGGAIAVWAPTGQGVAHGHDALQRGFYTKLWAAPPLGARIGELALAGYAELFLHGLCCHDAISTYALLGDAIMPARVMPARPVYLPLARH